MYTSAQKAAAYLFSISSYSRNHRLTPPPSDPESAPIMNKVQLRGALSSLAGHGPEYADDLAGQP